MKPTLITHQRTKFNPETDNISISFRMKKSTYDSIKTKELVEDLSLEILSDIEQVVKTLETSLMADGPNVEPVEITEDYED
jgi:hypothetical protein